MLTVSSQQSGSVTTLSIGPLQTICATSSAQSWAKIRHHEHPTLSMPPTPCHHTPSRRRRHHLHPALLTLTPPAQASLAPATPHQHLHRVTTPTAPPSTHRRTTHNASQRLSHNDPIPVTRHCRSQLSPPPAKAPPHHHYAVALGFRHRRLSPTTRQLTTLQLTTQQLVKTRSHTPRYS